MKLLLVGQADSIFFEHYTKALKRKDPNIEIDVFSIDAINGKYDLSACKSVEVNSWVRFPLNKVKGIRTVIAPFFTRISLQKYLRHHNNCYDIIHFKWLIPGVVLWPNFYLRYTKHIVATFWGQEDDIYKILYSRALYNHSLEALLKSVTGIIDLRRNALATRDKKKFYFGQYASSIQWHIKHLREVESKSLCKQKWGIPEKKISIAIGYSGKPLHRHNEIMTALLDNPNVRKHFDKFCILLQMNYGCSEAYLDRIEDSIKGYGVEYLLVRPGKYSDQDIARLRLATDIMIQLSSTDRCSGSILESIEAGVIMILGSWLPYSVFRDWGLHFYELDSIDSILPQLVMKIAVNFAAELDKCEVNKNRIPCPTWDSVIVDWINAYRMIMAR